MPSGIMRRCFGRTKNLHRCGREGDWKLFCSDHKNQPLVWIFVFVFSVIAGTASIYSAFFAGLSATKDALYTEGTKRLLPIADVKVSFRISIPITDTKLSKYRLRLEQGCNVTAEDFQRLRLNDPSEKGSMTLEKFNLAHDNTIGIGETCPDETGLYQPCSYLFGAESLFSPNRNDEELAFCLLRLIYIEFSAYKNPISIDIYKERQNRPKPHLSFVMITNSATDLSYRYKIDNAALLIEGENVDCDARTLTTSDQIHSLADLVGAQLFVSLNPINLANNNPAIYEDAAELRKEMHIHGLKFKIHNQEIEMPPASATPFRDSRGQRVFVATMPK